MEKERHWVGVRYSWGGAVAVAWAKGRYKDKMGGLILIDCLYGGFESEIKEGKDNGRKRKKMKEGEGEVKSKYG